METNTLPQHPTAEWRWAPVISATYAQATAFAAAAVLAFLITDVGAAFDVASGARLWPLGAFALGLVAAVGGARRVARIGPARYTGSAALAGLTLTAVAASLAPNFPFMLVTTLIMGVAAGLVIVIAGRIVIAAEVGDGTGSAALVALAVFAGIAGGAATLLALPTFGWRGVFGLLVVAAGMAAWKFAEHIGHE